eukprot:NODE_65_length_23997_cov_0.327601.p4 type:complete len:406 gc:universal NODE_65_length_23997_cov_0.327601:21660-20443(-)
MRTRSFVYTNTIFTSNHKCLICSLEPSSCILYSSHKNPLEQGMRPTLLFDPLNYLRSPAELVAISSKKLQQFYKDQNSVLYKYQRLLGKLGYVDLSVHESNEMNKEHAKWLIYISFLVTITIFVGMVILAISSKSLAILAASLDAVLDLVSTSILFITHRVMSKRNQYAYPIGRSRVENIGIILYSSVMSTFAIQVMIEAFKKFVAIANHESVPLDLGLDAFSVSLLIYVVFVKSALYFICKKYAAVSSSAHALAIDHRNDLLFNILSFSMGFAAYYSLQIWIDPLGGMLLSLFILTTWGKLGLEQIAVITGKAADKDFINEVCYLCCHFDELILQIDTVRCYHLSDNYLVEVDIVLSPDLPLKTAHDVGQNLQDFLEQYPQVERAYVHLDWEVEHTIEHQFYLQ